MRLQATIAKPAPISAWCDECQKHVELTNLRPWPEGVLAIGECPSCRSKLAARKPMEWGGRTSGRGVPPAA
ncbi:MAG: hypothetical protein FJ207_08415 [Gemmatimonadetes bacterium]|nr:hypothetical protein [Gemmatimonadota bacterium]